MSTRSLQWVLASVFFVLGGWCVVSPGSVLELSIRPEYLSDAPIVPMLVACFGAQALIAGLFAATSRFTRWTFLAYGIALLPFFVFDGYFYAVVPVLTEVGMVDLLGNIVMQAICWTGWNRAVAEESMR